MIRRLVPERRAQPASRKPAVGKCRSLVKNAHAAQLIEPGYRSNFG